MYRINRIYRFEAAHSLPHLPPSQQCHALHGHSYRVEVAVSGEVDRDGPGWIWDFAKLDAVLEPLVKSLDHSFLNDFFPYPTTSENLARWFFEEVNRGPPPSIQACFVSVSETESSKATYEGDARKS